MIHPNKSTQRGSSIASSNNKTLLIPSYLRKEQTQRQVNHSLKRLNENTHQKYEFDLSVDETEVDKLHE